MRGGILRFAPHASEAPELERYAAEQLCGYAESSARRPPALAVG